MVFAPNAILSIQQLILQSVIGNNKLRKIFLETGSLKIAPKAEIWPRLGNSRDVQTPPIFGLSSFNHGGVMRFVGKFIDKSVFITFYPHLLTTSIYIVDILKDTFLSSLFIFVPLCFVHVEFE
jgi:hypothetical protein